MFIENRNRATAKEAREAVALLRAELNALSTQEVTRLEGLIGEERTERRREHDRIDLTLSGLQEMRAEVAKVGLSIAFLTEKQREGQESTNNVLDELKHTVRNIASTVQGLAIDAARGPRSRAKGGPAGA